MCIQSISIKRENQYLFYETILEIMFSVLQKPLYAALERAGIEIC